MDTIPQKSVKTLACQVLYCCGWALTESAAFPKRIIQFSQQSACTSVTTYEPYAVNFFVVFHMTKSKRI